MNICRSKHSSSLPGFFASLHFDLIEHNFNVIYETQEKIFVKKNEALVCSMQYGKQ